MASKLPSATLILIFFLTHNSIIPQTTANHQTKALSHFYSLKLQNPSKVDRSHFNGSHRDFHGRHVIHPQHGLRDADFIPRLPGQPPVKFRQYGGYVTVDGAAGRALYYYFAEAQNPKTPASKLPLLLWLNGGPGCSSLAYGAMQELGPFRVHSDGKTLFKNRFAWNYAANVLFLESPSGVGFSYSNTTSDYSNNGDKKTANDNYAFLLNWLERFPEYKDRDFYISGESYAGHYVPELAHVILSHNLRVNKTIINLKGILIGNAVIHDETDLKGMYEYFGSHALVSDDTTAQILQHCNFSPEAVNQTTQCNNAASEAYYDIDGIDIYNIYAPVCLNGNLTEKPKRMLAKTIDPCSDNYVHAYLNRPEVQKAMHANVTKLSYDWQPCSNVSKGWSDSPTSVIPLLNEFLVNGLRVWIFSGDTDGRVPVTSTQMSIKKMNLKVKIAWHPWYLAQEVGGYAQEYEGKLTFATVRGAGHQVPSYQPDRALSLIMHFLAGTHLP